MVYTLIHDQKYDIFVKMLPPWRIFHTKSCTLLPLVHIHITDMSNTKSVQCLSFAYSSPWCTNILPTCQILKGCSHCGDFRITGVQDISFQHVHERFAI